MLYDFLVAHRVDHLKSQKLIVAADASELPMLDALMRQGETNGVEGLRLISGADAQSLEGELRCMGAILSEESGILDVHGYIIALQGDIETAGGAIALDTPFASARAIPGGFSIETGGPSPSTITSARLLIAAGLSAQACARAIEGFPSERIPDLHFGKGNYFALSGKPPFARLIYPSPAPGSVGLHYKRDLGGRAHFGPDLHFVEREDYDVEEARVGAFYAFVRRFWPALPDGALSPDFAGIRPKLHGPGEPQGDFVIDSEHGLPGLVALFGIESPGLTSSLALAEEVARRLA